MTEVDGRQTAQIMFFNLGSAERGQMEISVIFRIPYLEDNLAFSLQMEIAAANIIRDLPDTFSFGHTAITCISNRRHFWSRQGAQTNTVEEMRNAMELLAELLHQVLS